MTANPRFPGDMLDATNSALKVNMVAGTLTTGDIEIGAVELKNGTDDTRATVTAGNALKVDGSAVTQPVSHAAKTNAATTAYAASLVVKASAGTLYGITGYNSKASAQFIQLHDATALPSDTAVPKVVITVPATSNFSIDFGNYGRSFATGIVVANSSTGQTLTTASADCWIDAQYT